MSYLYTVCFLCVSLLTVISASEERKHITIQRLPIVQALSQKKLKYRKMTNFDPNGAENPELI